MQEKIVRSLDYVYPVFAAKVKKGLEATREQNYTLDVFESYRSPQRQLALYQQGRTTPGKIITQAMPFQSLHQFGLAVDLAFRTLSDGWNWGGDFAKATTVFKNASGLAWGGAEDAGHFELKGSLSTADMRRIIATDGLIALWMQLY